MSSTPEESKSNAEGVFVRDGAGSEAARISAEIGGDVNVNSHGAARGVSSISSNAKSDFSVEVGGNITATSTGLVPPGKDDVDGLEVQTAKDAISHIVVGGTIAVNAPQEKTGAYGVTVYGDEKSQTDIHVKGSISSNGGGESTGARLSSIGGDIRFKADQDVSGMSTDDQEGVGMVLESSKGGKVELVASGVVYGDKAGIRFDGDGAGTYDMTVWQVKSGQDGVLFSRGEISHEDLGSLTSQVKYIIRLEQPQEGGTIGATDALHAALAQSHGYDVARAGDKVYLNVNLDDGYYVSGAFNGRGEQVALLKDDGGYYVIVPEGGGVYLKVSLGKNAEVASEPEQAVPTDEARTYTTSKASAPLVVSAATNLLPATADASTSAAALVACVLLGAGLAFSGIVDRWR